jgi:hypothetical protein
LIFWFQVILLAILCVVFTIELANRGYNLIFILLPSVIWLLLTIFQSRGFVVITDLGNGKIEIIENTIYTKMKTTIKLSEIVDFRYGGGGQGFRIEKIDGSAVSINVNVSLGYKIANHISTMKATRKC